MKKFKKVLAVALVGAMMCSLVACGTSNEKSDTSKTADGKKIVTIWAWDPNFNISIMKEAAKLYEANHTDVDIQIQELAKADVEQKLHTTLASKTKKDLPEIVLIEDYNAQKYLTSYPGQFADLTKELDYSQFAKFKVDLATVEGKTYSVPFDSGVAGMFYRTDILEEAGYTAADLQNITWEDFINIGKDVKAKTNKYMLGFQTTDGGLMRIMLQSAGAWYFNEKGDPILTDNAALKEAMKMYKEIVDANIAKPTSSWDEWVGAINNGDAATITTGVWIAGSVKAPADQSGKWGVAPVPSLNSVSGATNASNLGGSSWYILQNSANKATAIDFMKTIYASNETDFYQTILMNNGAVGTYLPATSGDAYSTPDKFFGDKAIYADLAKWSTQIPVVNIGSYTYEADAAVMAQMEAYVKGDISLDDALKAAQDQLKSQIQ